RGVDLPAAAGLGLVGGLGDSLLGLCLACHEVLLALIGEARDVVVPCGFLGSGIALRGRLHLGLCPVGLVALVQRVDTRLGLDFLGALVGVGGGLDGRVKFGGPLLALGAGREAVDLLVA